MAGRGVAYSCSPVKILNSLAVDGRGRVIGIGARPHNLRLSGLVLHNLDRIYPALKRFFKLK